MQPYFFPYPGYFSLINSSDTFVILDDVQYIRRGWMNRNKINFSSPFYITVPVSKHKRESDTRQILVSKDSKWVLRHLNSFLHVYGKCVSDSPAYKYYSSLSSFDFLKDLLFDSLSWTTNFLGIKTEIIFSSEFSNTSNKKGSDKIIQICKNLNADTYLNLPGGKNLYSLSKFEDNGLSLKFLDTDCYRRISILEDIFSNKQINL
jgi:hypothetical protein